MRPDPRELDGRWHEDKEKMGTGTESPSTLRERDRLSMDGYVTRSSRSQKRWRHEWKIIGRRTVRNRAFFLCDATNAREVRASHVLCIHNEGGREEGKVEKTSVEEKERKEEKKNLARLRGRAFTKVVLLYPFRQLKIIRFLLG